MLDAAETSNLRAGGENDLWQAVLAKDRSFDGRFIFGVVTTGIYCRPSCAARPPLRENVRFFADGEAARGAGLRPCRRCRPDEVQRDDAAVALALKLISQAENHLSLDELAERAGYSPTHFQRIFAKAVGLSPAAYQRAMRLGRAQDALSSGARVTDAVYEAGFGSPSRFYAASKGRMGMSASAWRDGGRGETIGWAQVDTSLGPMLVAATGQGVCRLSFGEGYEELEQRFPHARLVEGGEPLARLMDDIVAVVENPASGHDIPLDVQGTAFQEAVWGELTRIPPGETRSYAQIADAIGKPGAVRAAGSANGANHVSVLIPCHRVIRNDGSLGGYAWGEDIKRELLRREGATD